jgi:hypothetical protein
VRDAVLVADAAIREIEALAGNIAVRVGSVISVQPVKNGQVCKRGRYKR